MIQDNTNSSVSITSQISTALLALLVEVWDIDLEYLSTHTISMHSTKILEDIIGRLCMPRSGHVVYAWECSLH